MAPSVPALKVISVKCLVSSCGSSLLLRCVGALLYDKVPHLWLACNTSGRKVCHNYCLVWPVYRRPVAELVLAIFPLWQSSFFLVVFLSESIQNLDSKTRIENDVETIFPFFYKRMSALLIELFVL